MYNFVGRLKPGVTRTPNQDDLKRGLLQLKSTYPDLWDQNESVRIIDLHDSLVGQVRPGLEMLMGAVALVLVIVSANILSLLLTRSIARRREMGLRAALGASGWRILRQLLVENALLCFLGGILGAVLAEFATPMLSAPQPLASAAVRQPAHRRTGPALRCCTDAGLRTALQSRARCRKRAYPTQRIAACELRTGSRRPQSGAESRW